ncbi:MAG: hypothetical protein F6K62_11510 [Sphaerospermopsis sp. SIO1G2]|nr:hypothetical protein [Sphaerospermopsis sp. SIO1G2]
MNRRKLFTIILTICVFSVGIFGVQPSALAGKWEGYWKNEGGSVMKIEEASPKTGLLTGCYKNGYPKYQECAPFSNKYPLTGWTVGEEISFTVNWGNKCTSLASWMGNQPSPTQINTTSFLIAQGSDKISKFTDIFTKDEKIDFNCDQ